MECAIVFTRTKHGADRVVRDLDRAGLEAAAIHGNKSQGQRQRALGAFRDGGLRILVAIDIVARGIDVDGISHVINYELSNVPETYVHRIGRTARAGADGIAISLCMPEKRAYLRDIERLTKHPLDLMPGEDPASDLRGEPGFGH
ncbi:helicase-related protein [Breoghania sp.]|uniref:helicase-related protein n=1 Tax=Breoghania sp. TaxID=2065378 RepID=UPI00260DDDCF|nr:helicase-related protein [Breoghania sp.]MDJ0932043.1 helicase-related protein [Breoghania sp.]